MLRVAFYSYFLWFSSWKGENSRLQMRVKERNKILKVEGMKIKKIEKKEKRKAKKEKGRTED